MRAALIYPLVLLAWSAVPLAGRAATVEGFAEPYRKIDLAPPEPGLIASIPVREGDRVSKGQVVATLDCELLMVGLEIAKAGKDARGRMTAAATERDLRATRLSKLDELYEKGHASEEEISRARADLELAEANVLAQQEHHTIDALEYKKTQTMIERRTLRSPIDGVVTRVYKEEKEFVSASSPTVLTVVQLDPLRITFSVPGHQTTDLKVGQKVPLMISETGATAEGTLELIAPVTDAESGTVRVKVLLDNASGKYRSGVRCALELDPGVGQTAAITNVREPARVAPRQPGRRGT